MKPLSHGLHEIPLINTPFNTQDNHVKVHVAVPGPSVRTSFFLLTFFHVSAQERSQLNFATSLSTAHLSVCKHFIFKQPIVSEERKTVDYIPFFCRVRFEGLKYI